MSTYRNFNKKLSTVFFLRSDEFRRKSIDGLPSLILIGTERSYTYMDTCSERRGIIVPLFVDLKPVHIVLATTYDILLSLLLSAFFLGVARGEVGLERGIYYLYWFFFGSLSCKHVGTYLVVIDR